MSEKWNVTFQIYRKKGEEKHHYDCFPLEVDPDEYVLDGIERIWAFHDRTLVFRHACHHSTCGACGMRVNGIEKLTCITPIREVTSNGGVIRVEPLRNFPVISDVAVDMEKLYVQMDEVRHKAVNSDFEEAVQSEDRPAGPESDKQEFMRLADCIECGLCVSACPICGSSQDYLGPAVLAGAHQHGVMGQEHILCLVDNEDGAWRCHSSFECTAVCPSNVEPGWRIMELRRHIVAERFLSLFGKSKRQDDLLKVKNE